MTGNLTGNVTGNVTGDLTGDVTGNVAGNLTGSVLTAAQTNITSVGTLGALTVTGDVTVDTNTLKVDSTNNRVGILNASPDVTLDIGTATDAVHMPVGTTAQRPTGAAGYFRYNSNLEQFEGYTTEWGSIGGGGGTNTFTADSFTGNGSTTAYALSQVTSSEDNLLVFIEGVFQQQDAYSIATSSGTTTLTFSAAPANGNAILIYSVASAVSGSNLNIDSMTGDGSDTTLTLSIAPVNENNTQVFIDGVYQSKANYSISGTTLTFSTAPPTGTAVEVMTFTQTDINVPVDGTITSAKLSGDLTTPGALTVTGGITATTADNTDTLSLISTDADASAGPNLRMYRNSASPADADVLGVLEFEGRNDTSQDVVYAAIKAKAADVSDGSEDSSIFINSMVAGTLQNRITILPTEAVINEGSQDLDFRVESDSNTHALFVDGGNNHVNIGTATDLGALFNVGGTSNFNGSLIVDPNTAGKTTFSLSTNAANDARLQMKSDTTVAVDIQANGASYFNGGDVLVGTTSGGARFRVTGAAGASASIVQVGTNGYPAISFNNTSGVQQGYIVTNASSVSLVSVSDQRLKDNIADADDAGSKIDSIQVRKFDWKADGSHQEYGMVAQELQIVAPEAVHQPADSEEMMGVDYSKLVPMLVKEIQSLRTRVQELENN